MNTLKLTDAELLALKEIVETWLCEGFVSKFTEEQKSILHLLKIATDC